jgi:RimJ/RimL family protein N-acetyltransferase
MTTQAPVANKTPANSVLLREVADGDLPIFFVQQMDPTANHMAAFTAKDPTDREAFTAHWNRILADATVIIKTILFDGQVAGSVLSYEEGGKPEVSYWIGKDYWGRGIATLALAEFLAHGNKTRPIYARVAKDNLGSRRVLQKCGFTIIDEARGFANARGAEIEELVLELT